MKGMLYGVVCLLGFFRVSWTFAPLPVATRHLAPVSNHGGFVPWRISMNDNDSNDHDSCPAPRRAGGRARLKSPSGNKKTPSKIPGWLTTLALPVAVVWFIGQLLFGGRGGSSSDYYYYQSSVYESRVYGAGGRVDTARKSSVRSNIPGLIEGKDAPRAQLPGKSNSIMDYDRRADEDFDRMLDREIESMMRLQRGIFNEFW